MSNVISSFLVGIGFDYDKKSAEQIGSGIDSIKSKALQLGSVVAGAFGIKALTADFAQSKDMLGKFAEVFGVTANDVQAFGNALATEGGSLESFMAQLESIERARARIRVGDVGFFAPAGKAGINPNDIANAKSATDAYLGLADSFAKMNQQQRINAAEALGLDEASIRLLSQGRGTVEELVAKYSRIRPLTNEMTESAAEFNRQWLEVSQNIGGVADAISAELLPVINDITKSINSWFGEDQSSKLKAISSLAKKAFGEDISAKQLSKDTGIPEWMFTETWIERYKKADSDLTKSFYDMFKIDYEGSDHKKPQVADDSYLYMMQPQGSTGDDGKSSTTMPVVDVYVGVQNQTQNKLPEKSELPPQFIPSEPKAEPAKNIIQMPKVEIPEQSKSVIAPVINLPLSVDLNKKENQQPASAIMPVINVEQPEPQASVIPFVPSASSADVTPATAEQNISPAEYMQHTNIVDIVTTRTERSSASSTEQAKQPTSRVSEPRQNKAQDINISLNLDGSVIDKRVVRVIDNMAQTAMDDLISSTGA